MNESMDSGQPDLTLLELVWASTMHRIDAWGVAIVVGLLAIIIHDSYGLGSYILLATISFAYWFGYTVNDYFDAPSDAQDLDGQHRNLFVQYTLTKTQAKIAFTIASLAILFGFGYFALPGLFWFLVSLAVIWTYSAPPVRLKSRPGFDLISHAIFVQTFPYLLFLALLDLDWLVIDYVVLAINFFASLTGQLAQQIRDYDVDLKTSRTFTTSFGLARARIVLSATTVILGLVTGAGFVFSVLPLYLLPVVILFAPTFYFCLKGIGRTPRSHAMASASLALLYFFFLAFQATIN